MRLERYLEKAVIRHLADPIVYTNRDKKPVNGIVYSEHNTGQLQHECNYRGGVLHGKFKRWNKDGRLLFETVFVNGTGTDIEYYKNGRLRWEKNYKNGALEDISREWYENGQLKFEKNYKEGVRDGTQRSWDENGQLQFEYHYTYQINAGEREKNKLLGYVLYGEHLHGHQRGWHKNARLSFELHYNKGVRDGLQREWSENGHLRFASVYDEGLLVNREKGHTGELWP